MEKEQMIQQVLSRGVLQIYPSREFLEERLKKGGKLTLYLGIDPTGPTLHLGHAIQLKKLKEFQDLGHQIILLIGDFTGMIGDPTDKMATRKRLTREEVIANAKLYKKQASKILDFKGPNKAELRCNSKWLSKMKFEDVLNLAAHMTVDQMLKRDMFDRRMKEGKPVYIHEFLYPLLQGYDSVAMEVDGEIGGNDQTFNMLAGRTLMKQMQNKEKFVMALKLLEDASGKKMGKTEGNMVSLNEEADEMFGKIMSWADTLIVPAFGLCTFASSAEIEEIKTKLASGANPKTLKIHLARDIVAIYHGPRKAARALKNFEKTFSKKEVPENIPEYAILAGQVLADVMVQNGVVSSKSEFRRLVEGGAVTLLDSSLKVTDPNTQALAGTYRVGKHRFIKLRNQ